MIKSGSSFTAAEPPKPFAIPNEDELVLAVQALGLGMVSYNNHVLASMKLNSAMSKRGGFFSFLTQVTDEEKTAIAEFSEKEVEKGWQDVCKVKQADYTVWNDTWRRPNQEMYLESQCITGVINLSESADTENLVPFIVFRGSVSAADWWRDLKSVKTTEYVSRNGKKSNGLVGSGFAEMVSELKKEYTLYNRGDAKIITHGHKLFMNKVRGINLMDEVLRLVHKYDNGLLITGHSLGGGCSNIFLLEMMLDHMDLIEKYKEKIRVVTFGAPRAVDTEVARDFERLPITFLRFVNNDDLVPDLPTKAMGMYTHCGKTFFPYVASNTNLLEQSLDPIAALPDWDTMEGSARANHSLWMNIYSYDRTDNTLIGVEDFSADAKSDNEYLRLLPLPTEFASSYQSHFVVDNRGYSRSFQNLLHVANATPRQVYVGNCAKAYDDLQNRLREKSTQIFKVNPF